MNFSEFYRYSSKLSCFSPDGKHLASVLQFKIFVREITHLQIMHTFTCVDTVQECKWSPDSQFLIANLIKRNIIHVFSLEYPDWQCKIDEGSAGLCTASWAPDSRHILSTAAFHLRITLWSLVDKSVSFIKHPKACSHNMDFSPGGRFMVLAERRNLRDYISLFDCYSWSLVKHFPCDTDDLDGVLFSPDGRVITVWDSPLRDLVVCYDMQGKRLASLHTHDLSDGVLGVKSLQWAPSSLFLAVGGYDGRCRVYEAIHWCCIADMKHPTEDIVPTRPQDKVSPIIYMECLGNVSANAKAMEKAGLLSALNTPHMYSQPTHSARRYDISAQPTVVPFVKGDPAKANPKIGVGIVSFSPDAGYLATRNDQQPTALWIWSVPRFELTVLLLQMDPIAHVDWDPNHPHRLAVCTDSACVYVWTPRGCLAVQTPTHSELTVGNLLWHPKGESLLLFGEKEFCLCLFENDKEEDVSRIDVLMTSLTRQSHPLQQQHPHQPSITAPPTPGVRQARFPGDKAAGVL